MLQIQETHLIDILPIFILIKQSVSSWQIHNCKLSCNKLVLRWPICACHFQVLSRLHHHVVFLSPLHWAPVKRAAVFTPLPQTAAHQTSSLFLSQCVPLNINPLLVSAYADGWNSLWLDLREMDLGPAGPMPPSKSKSFWRKPGKKVTHSPLMISFTGLCKDKRKYLQWEDHRIWEMDLPADVLLCKVMCFIFIQIVACFSPFDSAVTLCFASEDAQCEVVPPKAAFLPPWCFSQTAGM